MLDRAKFATLDRPKELVKAILALTPWSNHREVLRWTQRLYR